MEAFFKGLLLGFSRVFCSPLIPLVSIVLAEERGEGKSDHFYPLAAIVLLFYSAFLWLGLILSFYGFTILAWSELPDPYEPPTTELYEPPLPTPLDAPKPYAPPEPEDMHPDAVTARAYAAGDPETIKRLTIFE